MANSIFEIGLNIGEELEARYRRMLNQDAPFDNQIAYVYKMCRSRSTKVFERLMDMESSHDTIRYQRYWEKAHL